MSTAKRFISGSAASWANIFITLTSQLALVPIFLSHWSIAEYGCWLSVQALISFLNVLSTSHQNYLGFEFLNLGRDKKDLISLYFTSSIFFAIVIAIIELIISYILFKFGFIYNILNIKPLSNEGYLAYDAGLILIIRSVAWLFVSSISGIGGRLIATFDYYPRNAWWTVWLSATTNFTPALTVFFYQTDFFYTSLIQILSIVIINIPLHYDIYRIIRKCGIKFDKFSFSVGLHNAVRSIAIAVKTALDLFRQQGIRVLLTYFIGVKGVAEFSTTRTASNIALQGINTINGPMMPEFMRFLTAKDGRKVNIVFCIIWFLSVILLGPLLVVAQLIIPTIFNIWTRGKIPLEPAVFAFFSITLLIFALSQPAVAIIQGFNFLKTQLMISILVSIIAIMSICVGAYTYSILGVSIALLFTEIVSTSITIYIVADWLIRNKFILPKYTFLLSLISILNTVLGIGLITQYPQAKTFVLVPNMIISSLIVYFNVRYFRKVISE